MLCQRLLSPNDVNASRDAFCRHRTRLGPLLNVVRTLVFLRKANGVRPLMSKGNKRSMKGKLTGGVKPSPLCESGGEGKTHLGIALQLSLSSERGLPVTKYGGGTVRVKKGRVRTNVFLSHSCSPLRSRRPTGGQLVVRCRGVVTPGNVFFQNGTEREGHYDERD